MSIEITIFLGITLIIISFLLKKIKLNQYDVLNKEAKNVINELMKKSQLPQNICTDVYMILLQFSNNNKKNAYEYINEMLIPDLIKNNHTGDVGIAFGMLIDEIGLTQKEAKDYSVEVMNMMVKKNLE